MTIATVIDAGFFRDVTLRRYAAGSYVAGKWTNGALTTSTIKASVQAATQRDIQSMPEGRRADGVIVLFTATFIQGIDESGAKQADEFSIEGETYEARTVEWFPYFDLAHYRVVAIKVKENG